MTVLKIAEKSGFDIPLEKLKKGFVEVKAPCRMEVLKCSPLVILDASHNVESVTALANFIKENLGGKRPVALAGMFADKDAEGVFKIIGKYFKKIAVVKSENPRSMEASELEKIAKKYCADVVAYEDIKSGAKKTLVELSAGECLIAFGSFSIMDSLKKIILSS